MGDYEVGRGKPPKHSRFKPGNNANPNGRRGKRKPVAIVVISLMLRSPAKFCRRTVP